MEILNRGGLSHLWNLISDKFFRKSGGDISGSVNIAQDLYVNNTKFHMFILTPATSTTPGNARFDIGNNVSSGTNNYEGSIAFYGKSSSYALLSCNENISSDISIRLPQESGILATINQFADRIVNYSTSANASSWMLVRKYNSGLVECSARLRCNYVNDYILRGDITTPSNVSTMITSICTIQTDGSQSYSYSRNAKCDVSGNNIRVYCNDPEGGYRTGNFQTVSLFIQYME